MVVCVSVVGVWVVVVPIDCFQLLIGCVVLVCLRVACSVFVVCWVGIIYLWGCSLLVVVKRLVGVVDGCCLIVVVAGDLVVSC